MDEWLDGGRSNEGEDEWMDGWMYECMDDYNAGRTNRRRDRWIDVSLEG